MHLDEHFRIKQIPFNDKEKSLLYSLILIASIVGVALGVGLAVAADKPFLGIGLVVISLLATVVGLFVIRRRQRESWQCVTSTVIDREIIPLVLSGSQAGTCVFRLLCEFTFDGVKVQTTPVLFWFKSDFGRTEKLLQRLIDQDQQCQLWVKPQEPRHTEIYSGGWRDRLIYGKRDAI